MDRLDYLAIDQVIPLFPEQQFFLDELQHEKIQEANVLEIGLGSGVLSIGAARAGAKHVTALEINPRAKNLAGSSMGWKTKSRSKMAMNRFGLFRNSF